MNQKGICTNYGECPKADSKELLEVPPAEDFVCQVCHSPLQPAEQKRKSNVNIPLMVSVAVVVCLIISGSIWYFLTPPNPDKQVEKLLTEAFPWLRN